MQFIRKTQLFIIFLIMWSIACSQTADSAGYRKWQLKGYARSAERIGDIYSAIDYYQILNKQKTLNDKYKYKIASLYFDVGNYEKAADLFWSVYQKNEENYDALFYFAKSLKTQGKYDTALTHFTFLESKLTKNAKVGHISESRIIAEKKGCELAIAYRDTIVTTRIFHLNESVNKSHIEFAPHFINDSTFVYGSLKVDTLQSYQISENENLPKRKFYFARKIEQRWQGGFDAPMPFYNFEDAHTGNGAFSLDGNRFYFSKCSKNWKYQDVCQLYVSEKNGTNWSEAKLLKNNINTPKYSSSQPTVGTCYDKDLEVIYFVSNRPGGMGGSDIWYTTYNTKTKKYHRAANAGVFINTSQNEITPFFDTTTHSMYFSSDGWPGFGGYDIFKVSGDLVNWSDVENIAYPINSSYDDLYYSKNDNYEFGFFTSNRQNYTDIDEKTCCDDIYMFQSTNQEQIVVNGILLKEKLLENNQFFQITNLETPNATTEEDNFLDSIIVSLHQKKDSLRYLYIAADTTNERGEYEFEVEKNNDYKIVIDDDNVINKEIKFTTKKSGSVKKIVLDSEPVKVIPKQAITLKNIYYEFDKWELTDSARQILDASLIRIMKTYPELKIEINSHTDSIGTEEYNLELSQKRAENVVAYLVENGISQNRLIYKGFGSSKPIAPNSLPDGTDNPAGRKKNRRTQFKIIGKIDIE